MIISINGEAVHGPADVAATLAKLAPEQTVRVEIARRDGSRATVTVTLDEYPGRA